MNRTQKALDLMRKNPGMTANEAAKLVKISPSAVYRAIKSAEGKRRCPTCGHVVKDAK